MDPLLPAFVAVLLAGVADRPASLAALLADRHGAGAAWPGVVLGQAAGFALAAAAGTLIAPHLTPNARALLLAFALLSAGGATLFRATIRDRLDGWRLPPFVTATLGAAILALGDRSQFLVFALTARTPDPLLAAIGGTLAAAIPAVAAATLGERAWAALPFAVLRPVAGALLLLAGVATGLGALRLV